MPRSRLNLALLVVAVALGVAVFFSQKKEEKGPPLTALTPDAVTKIALEHPGAPAIRLEKQGGAWRLTEPVQAEVDELEVNALLGLADDEVKEKLEGARVAELNLDPPQYTVTLNDVAVAIGGVEPLQYRRYAKVGEAVGLIEDPPSAAFDKDYADLVAKALFPAGAEIARIELPKLTLAKGPDGKWGVKPGDPKATADSMQALADAWKGARSMWNETARDARVKGGTVKVTLADGTARTFVIAATDPQFKLHRADLGVTFVLSKALTEQMLKLPEPKKEEAAKPDAGNAAPDAPE
jgi:hypothetical protein